MKETSIFSPDCIRIFYFYLKWAPCGLNWTLVNNQNNVILLLPLVFELPATGVRKKTLAKKSYE
jgi:hypothetical protein